MSVGQYHVYLDQYNTVDKVWTGGNGKTRDNTYSCDKTLRRSTRCAYYQYGVFQMYVYNFVPRSAASTLRPFANEELEALSKLADTIRGHSFDASVFVGELGQTADLIGSNCKKVLTAYRDLRRGNWEQCLRTLGTFSKGHKGPKSLNYEDLASFWLELKYGWEPLIGDVYEGCKAIDVIKKKQNVVYRASQTLTDQVVADSLGNLVTRRNSVRLKCTLTENPSTMASLNLQNPATVLWELTPWSFVVDWFVPVGAYLSNASFFSSISRKTLTTYFRINEFKSKFGTVVTAPGAEYRGGGYDWTVFSLARVFTAPSIPLPSFKSLEKALSLGHLKNAAALVAGQIALARSAH